jgi:hypothetical protein
LLIQVDPSKLIHVSTSVRVDSAIEYQVHDYAYLVTNVEQLKSISERYGLWPALTDVVNPEHDLLLWRDLEWCEARADLFNTFELIPRLKAAANAVLDWIEASEWATSEIIDPNFRIQWTPVEREKFYLYDIEKLDPVVRLPSIAYMQLHNIGGIERTDCPPFIIERSIAENLVERKPVADYACAHATSRFGSAATSGFAYSSRPNTGS